jgi:hypothetical protein
MWKLSGNDMTGIIYISAYLKFDCTIPMFCIEIELQEFLLFW